MGSFKEKTAKLGKTLWTNLVLIVVLATAAFWGFSQIMPNADNKTLAILSLAALAFLYIILKIGSLLIKLAIIIAIVVGAVMFLSK